MKNKHPYEIAVQKIADVVETDKFLTLKSVDKLSGVENLDKRTQSLEMQITVEIYITSQSTE